MYWLFLFLFGLFSPLIEAKAPELTPLDVKLKTEEILKTHATHKQLTPQLVERTLLVFLDELDPFKTYFLKPEIQQWLTPEEVTLSSILQEIDQANFGTFYEIFAFFETAIQRRNALESQNKEKQLPATVNSEDFKEISWLETPQELSERLLAIQALQLDTAKRLGDENRDLFVHYIEKRRLNRESEFLHPDVLEKNRLILSYILKAFTAALDSHTNYFTPSEANQFMIQVQQRLFGIGAQLKDHLDGFIVTRILENSPAACGNKLKINDRIIAVNREPVVGLDITEAVEFIRGEAGTPVLLTILRESGEKNSKQIETIEVELVRGEVILEESRLETHLEPYANGAIAHLRLFSFYQDPRFSSAGDIRKALEKMKEQAPLKGVILDLRNNGGGLLPQAVAVTGLFIRKGIVVSIKDNSGKVQHLREIEGNPVWEGPLLVLVNRASASAAEIAAQTLQDYGRALVIGDEHTFGKGTFQTFTLDQAPPAKINQKGEYKVTRGKYYTVSGKSPQLIGVKSDIVIPGILSFLDVGEKFSRYPLENDQIEPHFDDDLADISPLYRLQFGPMYRYNMQQRLTHYIPFLETLRKNSTQRIASNKHYQHFLKEAEKKSFDSEAVSFFELADMQFTEALSVMKDLIFLLNEAVAPAA